MSHALTLAAKRGVDVRIITPGIPDKKPIYSVTRSFYNQLVKHGVRILVDTGLLPCKDECGRRYNGNLRYHKS